MSLALIDFFFQGEVFFSADIRRWFFILNRPFSCFLNKWIQAKWKEICSQGFYEKSAFLSCSLCFLTFPYFPLSNWYQFPTPLKINIEKIDFKNCRHFTSTVECLKYLNWNSHFRELENITLCSKELRTTLRNINILP